MRAQRTSAVSVIVPALNEEASIGNLLDALASQTSVPDEVVVVDAGSSDGTRAEAESRSGRFRNFRVVDCPGAYPGRARNRGASLAANARLVFLDCGLAIELDCIDRLATASTEHDAAYGWVVPQTDRLFTECAAIAYLQPMRRDGEPIDRPTVQMMSIDRELFQRLNGFPEELRSAEDLLFLDGLARDGATVGFASTARARWELCPNLRSTFGRFRAYSMHNLKAGLARQWQRPLAIYYAGWLAASALALTLTSQWLTVPLLLVAFVGLRAGRRLWRHREDTAANGFRRLIQLPVVMAILFTIDLATAWGTLDYLYQLTRTPEPSRFASDEPRSKDA